MKNQKKRWWLVLMLSLLISVCVGVPASIADRIDLEEIAEEVTGKAAYEHVYYLSEIIGARKAGTAQEKQTADYIAEQFEDMDYRVTIQPFSFTTRSGDTLQSQNIVAVKRGRSQRTIIVGAHYDSEEPIQCSDGNTLTGAGDNASGVGVMLEAAEFMSEDRTRATVVFVAFGGEEIGLLGAKHYAAGMSADEIADTAAMINLDSVGAGDFFYVYAGLDGNPGDARDMALDIGGRLEHDLRTSPQSEFFDWGTTGDWSDHVPFRLLGIPIAYFEWMNWDIEPNGGIETEAYGWIMHSCRDNLAFTSRRKLELTAEVLTGLVYKLARQKEPKKNNATIMKAKRTEQFRIQKRPGRPE